LFINTVHHQRQRFSAATPQPITAADPPPRRPAHQSHRAIGNSTSTPITANDHNQDTSTRRFTAFNNPQRRSHSRSLSSATQISVTNHLLQPPLTRTLQQQHQSQCHHPQCPRLQQRQRINASTGPRPAATPQTPQPLPSHRRAQAESRSPVSYAITVSTATNHRR
jgi:hypothetical protein